MMWRGVGWLRAGHRLCACVGLGLVAAPGLVALAQDVRTVPADAAPGVEIPVLVDDEGRDRGYWRERVIEARRRVETARRAIASAEARLQNARQKKRPRGDALDALEQAKTQLAEAEAELAALPEEARRAGAPPGWLRVEEPEAG